jgi:hypothetical protein
MGDHLWEPICVNTQGNLWLAHSDAQVRTVLLFNDILLVRTSAVYSKPSQRNNAVGAARRLCSLCAIIAIRVPIMAIRVPIMAIRVPIMAIRVLLGGCAACAR